MAKLDINGKALDVDVEGDTPLLYVLRDDLKMNGAKFGCGLGQCGACTVLVDNKPVFSCLVPVSVLEGRKITTIEGLGTVDKPGPLQRAFIEEQAAQCGYCTAGIVMRAEALLRETREPSDGQIRQYLSPNLCRCGTHNRVIKAVKRAAQYMRSASVPTTIPGTIPGSDRT